MMQQGIREGAEPAMLSIPHLIIIFVVALVVFGPEKLPELARNLGKVMAEFRRATGELRNTFEGHLRDLERESEQRRIGGAPAVSAGVSTVPATPPQASAGLTTPIDPAAVETPSEKHQGGDPPASEKPSDGGTRPA